MKIRMNPSLAALVGGALVVLTASPAAFSLTVNQPPGSQIGVLPPTPLARYYAAAKGGYTSNSEMNLTITKAPNAFANTDLAVVIRRTTGTFVSGHKLLKAAPSLSVTLPSNPSVCAVEGRGDKLCDDNVKVCGGSVVQSSHFQIAVYTLTSVPDPQGNPPALQSSLVRKVDAGLVVTKGVGLRPFNPATKEYPLTKNANYLPAPEGVNAGSTCRPGPEPWPEPEPSYNGNGL